MLSYRGWGKDGFGHHMPFHPSDRDIDGALLVLRQNQLLAEDGDGNLRFAAYRTNPSNTFKHLVDICQSLQRVTLENENCRRSPTCELVQNIETRNTAETPDANFRSNALLKLIRTTIPPEPSFKFRIGDLDVLLEYTQGTQADVRIPVYYFYISYSLLSSEPRAIGRQRCLLHE